MTTPIRQPRFNKPHIVMIDGKWQVSPMQPTYHMSVEAKWIRARIWADVRNDIRTICWLKP